MAFEFDVTSGLIIALIGLGLGFVYFIFDRKYRKKTDAMADRRSQEQIARIDKGQVDALADRVKKDQAETAEKLKRETENIAERTKKDMQYYVDRQTETLKTDYQHKFEVVDLKLHAINEAITQVIARNAETALVNAKTAERLEKGLDFLKQFMWGTQTKSDPGYLSGKEDTAEHIAAEGEGIFKDTQEEATERENKTE